MRRIVDYARRIEAAGFPGIGVGSGSTRAEFALLGGDYERPETASPAQWLTSR